MSNRNDRSDAALQKRLELAKKATHGPWVLWEWDNGVKEIRSNADPDEDHVCRVWHKKDGDFLAKNSPIEVQADIEEILRLRAEVERLNKVSHYLAERLSPLNVTRRKYIGATLEDGYGNALFLTREEAIRSWLDEANREVNNAG